MDLELEEVLAQPGAYTRQELLARYGRARLERSLSSGRLVVVARGIYAATLHVDSLWTAAQALVLACNNKAGMTGRAALAVRGCLSRPPETALVVTTSPTRIRRRPPRARLLRTVHPFGTIDINGIPVTGADLALVHAVGEVSQGQARALALEALSTGLIDVESVAQMARERNFRGQRVLRDALVAFDAGVRSILEYEGRESVLTGPEFAGLVRQHSITVNGRRMDIDAYDPHLRLAFEFDGYTFHTDPDSWQRDRERDTLLASVGIQTVRFTSRDVRVRPQWCRARALEVRDQRLRFLAA